MSSIVVIRADRLGDVLTSLPALRDLRAALPQVRISFAYQAAWKQAIEPFLKNLQIESEDPATTEWKRFETAVLLSPGSEELKAVWRARVPRRVGNFSRPWSFILLTHGIRQTRSSAEQSEVEYSRELAHRAIRLHGGTPPSLEKIEIPADPEAQVRARKILQDLKLSERGFVIVHPGGRGSALNLSPQKYFSLLDPWERRYGRPILLSEGPAPEDKEVVQRLLVLRPGTPVLRGQGLDVLREVFRWAHLVIAPSTGPLHLAHYAGTPTLGLYPPVQSQRASRWAPTGGTGQARALFPNVPCPALRECLGPRCEHYSCMERATWGELPLSEGDDLSR